MFPEESDPNEVLTFTLTRSQARRLFNPSEELRRLIDMEACEAVGNRGSVEQNDLPLRHVYSDYSRDIICAYTTLKLVLDGKVVPS